MPTRYPRTAYDKVGGMVYFARMVDKIRLEASGELPQDYFENLGKGMDGRTCKYLHVDYSALKKEVLGGLNDEQAFAWCQKAGRTVDEVDILIYNGFSTKRGWKDEASEVLESHKKGSGLGHRTDIVTFFDFFEVDEKRRP